MSPAPFDPAADLAGEAFGVYQRAWSRVSDSGNARSDAQRRRQAGERAVRAYLTTGAGSGSNYTEPQYIRAFQIIREAQTAARDLNARLTPTPLPAGRGGQSPVPFADSPPDVRVMYRVVYTYQRQNSDRVFGGTLMIPAGGQLALRPVLDTASAFALGQLSEYESDRDQQRYGPAISDPQVRLEAVWIR